MLRELSYFEDVLSKYASLTIYKNIKNDEILQEIVKIAQIVTGTNYDKKTVLKETYYNLIAYLINEAEEKGYIGDVLKKHIINLFLEDINLFSLSCENMIKTEKFSIFEIVSKDIEILKFFMEFDIKNLTENIGNKENIIEYKPISPKEYPLIEQIEVTNDISSILEQIIWGYSNLGIGDMAYNCMFKIKEKKEGDLFLFPSKNADKSSLDDIIGYESQKEEIVANTEAFIAGRPANNMLLVGSRGTGKSSCVKAIGNAYFEQGVRVINLEVRQIGKLKELFSEISSRGKKFIIFIDDLSFEEVDNIFLDFKSILEGDVEVFPGNVLFYVTSNRRHIIKEKWADKNESPESEEIHTTDSVNEKLSLSDRFGRIIFFPKPNPKEYVDIVMGIAKKEKISLPEDFLKDEAMKWEINQKGLSGRTARQFVNNIICEIQKI